MPDDAQGSTATAPVTEAAPAVPATAPASFDWKTAGLDDGGMAFVTEKQWKSPVDTITSYRQLESAFGVPPERLIKLPAPRDAGDPKAWDAIHAKLGRPETPDKYVIPVPEGDKGEFANAVKPWLHEAGISQSAATKLATKWNEFLAQTEQQKQAATEVQNAKDKTELKQEWGVDYDAKDAVAFRAIESFGMTREHMDSLMASMGFKNAMTWLYNIGSKVAVEDTHVPGMTGQAASFGGMTPEMARAKIAEYSKPGSGFAQLMESKDPKQRMEARNEWNKLHQLAATETPSAPARRA